MKLGIIAGNTGNTTLLNTNKVGTEPFTKMANYIEKEVDKESGASSYTDATKKFKNKITNASGSIVQVDRTLVIGRQSSITVKMPDSEKNMIMVVDAVGGEKNMGKAHINSTYVKDEKGKLQQTDGKYIIEPNVNLYNFVDFVNDDIISINGIDKEGIEKLKEIKSVNSITGVDLANIVKDHVTEDVKNSRAFIKSSTKLGIDFDAEDFKIHIADFRGVYLSDVELLEAKQYGYFNPDHYTKTENKILSDLDSFLKEKEIEINIVTKNTNFIDFGHDEVGNIVINKSAKIPEVSNGYMFKNLGLDKSLSEIGTATSNLMGLLNPNKNEEDREKITRGLELLNTLVENLDNKNVAKEFAEIDTVKVINSNSIAEISSEFNSLMNIAFAVKSKKLNDFAKEHSILDATIVKHGGDRLVGKKYGYERERGLNLKDEKLILRMASLHEIRPLTIDKGVDGGMQVKSQKVSALEFLFDKDDKLLRIDNGASLSNYNKTYNKLALVLHKLIYGDNNPGEEKLSTRLLSEEEFSQNMYKGKIYGKDEKNNPKYTGYGLKSIADILLQQTTNVTTGEAIEQFKKRIEAVHKESGVEAVSNYILESQDKLVRVFRDFYESAFPEFRKNIGISKTQYMNYPIDKNGNPTETKQALKALIDGTSKEDLSGSFSEKASKNAISLVSKALYVQLAAQLSNEKEAERLKSLTIPEDSKKYYDAAYIASSIGKSEYVMKMRNNTWWDATNGVEKLQSPKSNFAQSTDKGILVKNQDGANVPDEDIVFAVLKKSEDAKKELAVHISELIKESFSVNKKTTMQQGESVELSINIDDGGRSVRDEGKPTNEEARELVVENEADLEKEAEEAFGASEKQEEEVANVLQEEIDAEIKETIEDAKIVEEIETSEAAENELGVDLSFFDYDEEDEGIQAEKASEIAVTIQKEDSEQAVGASLLR